MTVVHLKPLCLLVPAILILAGPAHSEFRVCNQSLNLFNVAVGTDLDGKFTIEGWWTVPANTCLTPLKKELQSKYVYVHALSVTGEDLLKGEWDMCIKPEKFVYIRQPPDADWNCWASGFQRAKFAEINVGNAKSWTVFIQQPTGGQ
jgi:uncharacterized membrane protein